MRVHVSTTHSKVVSLRDIWDDTLLSKHKMSLVVVSASIGGLSNNILLSNPMAIMVTTEFPYIEIFEGW